ncbi:MAG: hypothetical protein F6K10_03080 [Moorea sp. SIO2B7]|nr:hypothetical protein [Moorena sp. SIO2B7]
MIDLIGGVFKLVKWGAEQLSRNGATVLALTQNHIANKNLKAKKKIDQKYFFLGFSLSLIIVELINEKQSLYKFIA